MKLSGIREQIAQASKRWVSTEYVKLSSAEIISVHGGGKYDITIGSRLIKNVLGEEGLQRGNIVSILDHPGRQKRYSILRRERFAPIEVKIVSVR